MIRIICDPKPWKKNGPGSLAEKLSAKSSAESEPGKYLQKKKGKKL